MQLISQRLFNIKDTRLKLILVDDYQVGEFAGDCLWYNFFKIEPAAVIDRGVWYRFLQLLAKLVRPLPCL